MLFLVVTGASGWARARRPAARDRTRQAIVETALRLFAERGYVGVRVEDIAHEAGLSRATFYKHFGERDEILGELFARLLAEPVEVSETTHGGVEGRVRALVDATAAQMIGNELLARFVYSLPIRHDAVLPGGTAAPAVFATVRDVLEEAATAGELREGMAVDRILEVLGRVFEAAMRDWAEGHVDDPRDRLAELLAIVFHGVAGSKPRPPRAQVKRK